MEQAYAQALLKMIQSGPDRAGTKPAEAVRAMRAALEARGRTALLPNIARAFARLAARQEARTRLTLSVAREKDVKAALKEVKEILAEQKIADAELCEEIDETLIGGWRLEGQGLLVDQSWKSSLLSMYNRATQ